VSAIAGKKNCSRSPTQTYAEEMIMPRGAKFSARVM
jgi:hypothetical protein